MSRELPPMPPSLAARPRDERRGLPIPATAVMPDGSVDFVLQNSLAGLAYARERRCSLCTEPMPPKVAFLGGEGTAGQNSEQEVFTDPPACPACMTAALQLCPYIAIGRARRATAERAGEWSEVDGTRLDKPQAWVMVIARSYEIAIVPTTDGDRAPVYLPQDVVRTDRYEYGPDGRLALAEAPGN